MKQFLALLLCFGCFAPSARPETATTTAESDLSQFTTADQLWNHIEEQKQGPKNQPQSQAEAIQMFHNFLQGLVTSTDQFSKRYPKDPRSWDAKLLKLQASAGLAKVDQRSISTAEMEAGLKEIADATDASAKTKADARAMSIGVHAMSINEPVPAETATKAEAEIAAFLKDYPADPRTAQFQVLQAQWQEKVDPAKAGALWEQLARSDNLHVAQAAQSQISLRNLKKKPIELAFTAVDGTPVDLARLRGKVVLIDFWATWCGPCRRQIPDVISAYQKYHDKGLEILGISLDQDKEKLLAMTREKGMAWPQYFDGKAWENKISSQYGINAIPAQWLVDKKGFVRYTEVGEDFMPLIEKLLAE